MLLRPTLLAVSVDTHICSVHSPKIVYLATYLKRATKLPYIIPTPCSDQTNDAATNATITITCEKTEWDSSTDWLCLWEEADRNHGRIPPRLVDSEQVRSHVREGASPMP